MAKNISRNQWFKDIIDDVYLNTAVLNNILIIAVHPTNQIAAHINVATIRNPELFDKADDGTISNLISNGITVRNGRVYTNITLDSKNIGFSILQLKNKQLETDFYSPEQLAEIYPDDPAYQVATDELTDETKPVVDPVDDMGVT